VAVVLGALRQWRRGFADAFGAIMTISYFKHPGPKPSPAAATTAIDRASGRRLLYYLMCPRNSWAGGANDSARKAINRIGGESAGEERRERAVCGERRRRRRRLPACLPDCLRCVCVYASWNRGAGRTRFSDANETVVELASTLRLMRAFVLIAANSRGCSRAPPAAGAPSSLKR